MTYPAPAPTLSGDLLTIHRLLQNPNYIKRRLRDFKDLRFVSDQILTQRLRSSGGAILYEQSEPVMNARAVTAVAPGSEYPHDTPAAGTAVLGTVQNWGQGTFLTDAKIKRSVYAGDEVSRTLRKVVNTVINKVDAVTLAAVAAAVSQTQPATAAWSAGSGTNILRDIELAVAVVLDTQQGYRPDSILMSSSKYGYMVSDPVITNARRRETTDNPIYAGTVDVIGGLKVITAPTANLPTNDVWIFDSTMLGGMADEMDQDPGYTVSDMAVQVQSMRVPQRDGWDMWGRRITVPAVQEPGAAIRVTGT